MHEISNPRGTPSHLTVNTSTVFDSSSRPPFSCHQLPSAESCETMSDALVTAARQGLKAQSICLDYIERSSGREHVVQRQHARRYERHQGALELDLERGQRRIRLARRNNASSSIIADIYRSETQAISHLKGRQRLQNDYTRAANAASSAQSDVQMRHLSMGLNQSLALIDTLAKGLGQTTDAYCTRLEAQMGAVATLQDKILAAQTKLREHEFNLRGLEQDHNLARQGTDLELAKVRLQTLAASQCRVQESLQSALDAAQDRRTANHLADRYRLERQQNHEQQRREHQLRRDDQDFRQMMALITTAIETTESFYGAKPN